MWSHFSLANRATAKKFETNDWRGDLCSCALFQLLEKWEQCEITRLIVLQKDNAS